MVSRLSQMEIDKVALVDRGANGRRFALLKRDAPKPTADQIERIAALAAGIAKGRGEERGVLAAIKKVVRPKKRVAKSAKDLVARATWALTNTLELLEIESADLAEDPTDPDAAEDRTDVTTLQQIADLWGTYITATSKEVGTPDDLEDIAEDAAAYAQLMTNQYPVYMRDGGIAKADPPVPKSKAAMSDHLTAAKPGGHAVADSTVADSTMADMTTQHDSMHGSGSGAKHSHGDAVAKVGLKQFSAARLSRLKEKGAAAFAAVLEEEIASEQADDAGDGSKAKKRAQPEEEPMTSDELAEIKKAISEAVAPVAADVADLKKNAPVAKAEDKPATLDDVAKAVGLLADRMDKYEGGPRGQRTSADGQDPSGPVKKRGGLSGFLSEAP